MAAMPGGSCAGPRTRPTSSSRSLNAAPPPRALRYCVAAGSSNEASPGSSRTAVSSATTSSSPPLPKPSSSSLPPQPSSGDGHEQRVVEKCIVLLEPELSGHTTKSAVADERECVVDEEVGAL